MLYYQTSWGPTGQVDIVKPIFCTEVAGVAKDMFNVTDFCGDDSEENIHHDELPTNQNLYCNGKSTWSVILNGVRCLSDTTRQEKVSAVDAIEFTGVNYLGCELDRVFNWQGALEGPERSDPVITMLSCSLQLVIVSLPWPNHGGWMDPAMTPIHTQLLQCEDNCMESQGCLATHTRRRDITHTRERQATHHRWREKHTECGCGCEVESQWSQLTYWRTTDCPESSLVKIHTTTMVILFPICNKQRVQQRMNLRKMTDYVSSNHLDIHAEMINADDHITTLDSGQYYDFIGLDYTRSNKPGCPSH